MKRTPHKVAVGNNLRLAIEATEGGNQAAFARKMGVSATKLGNWLRGDNYPDPQFLDRACEEYGLTMDWFYRGSRQGVAASVADSLRTAARASGEASPVVADPERGKTKPPQRPEKSTHRKPA